jgi:predicted flap endonuclease-1-like 5' DNA nuclease
MPEFTTNQWIVLGLVFVLGWLVGLLTRRQEQQRWQREFKHEHGRRVAMQQDYEARLAAAKAETHDRPVSPVNDHDDLTRIEGIDRGDAVRLNAIGIHVFHDITDLSRAAERDVEDRLRLPPGTIDRQHWREQAAALALDRPQRRHAV